VKYLQYIVGIAILCIILFRIDLKQAADAISNVNILLLLAISLLTIPQIFLKSLRWRYLLKLQNTEYGIFNSFISYAKGIYCGIITPGRLGELIKVAYLKDEKNVEAGEGFSSVLMDRFFDAYILVAISMFGLLRFRVTEGAVWIFAAGILILIPLIFVAVKVDRVGKIFKRIFNVLFSRNKKGFLSGQAESFYRGMKKIPVRGMAFAFLLTLFIYMLAFTQYYLLSRLIDLKLSFVDVALVSSMASFVAILPVSFLGIGTRDAALIYLFGKAGIANVSAVIYSFLIFFSFYIMGAFAGFISWNIRIKKAEAGN